MKQAKKATDNGGLLRSAPIGRNRKESYLEFGLIEPPKLETSAEIVPFLKDLARWSEIGSDAASRKHWKRPALLDKLSTFGSQEALLKFLWHILWDLHQGLDLVSEALASGKVATWSCYDEDDHRDELLRGIIASIDPTEMADGEGLTGTQVRELLTHVMDRRGGDEKREVSA